MGKSRPQRKLHTAVPPQTRQPTRKDKFVNRVLPLAGEWKFTRTAERITWWQTGDTKTAHWSMLLFSFLLVSGGMIAVFVFGFLAAAVLIVIASIFKSEPMGTFPSDDYKIFWWILIACVVMGGAFAAMIASTKHVFRFEIDLEGQEIILHESYFPTRRRVLRVPFSSITSIRPRKMKTYGGADLELRYAYQGGAQVEKSLGMDLPEDILKGHLDCLRPAINERVLEMIDYAD